MSKPTCGDLKICLRHRDGGSVSLDHIPPQVFRLRHLQSDAAALLADATASFDVRASVAASVTRIGHDHYILQPASPDTQQPDSKQQTKLHHVKAGFRPYCFLFTIKELEKLYKVFATCMTILYQPGPDMVAVGAGLLDAKLHHVWLQHRRIATGNLVVPPSANSQYMQAFLSRCNHVRMALSRYSALSGDKTAKKNSNRYVCNTSCPPPGGKLTPLRQNCC